MVEVETIQIDSNNMRSIIRALLDPGFEILPNFGEIFRFRSVPGKNISVFSENFVLKIQNSKNSSEIRRKSPKFRNGIPFPPITGISPENEMVNPGLAQPICEFPAFFK